MDEMYIKARLDSIRFAVPAEDVLKILPEPVTVSVPEAPEGICGLVYDTDAILAIRSVSPMRRVPSRLVILSSGSTGRAAFAADDVDTMEPLDQAEMHSALPFGNTGVLLLKKEVKE